MAPRGTAESDSEARYVIADSPLGKMLVAGSDRGLCAVAFGDTDAALAAALAELAPGASPVRGGELQDAVGAIVASLDGGNDPLLPLDVAASPFTMRVWDALRRVPRGEVRTYGAIAQDLGDPRLARAVGTACGANPVSVVIPCHRAVRSDGGLGGYRWGLDRKRWLLANEGAVLPRSRNEEGSAQMALPLDR